MGAGWIKIWNAYPDPTNGMVAIDSINFTGRCWDQNCVDPNEWNVVTQNASKDDSRSITLSFQPSLKPPIFYFNFHLISLRR